jgi:non-canonical purine NTP pyrophosphatase (RdgB/HAM1 family)
MLTIVTGNNKKYSQISWIINEVTQTRQEKIDLEEIQTADLKEISTDKAMKAFSIVQWPVLVDDSGIVFDTYPWFPGALTKFLYEWVGMQWMRRMFQWVENRKADFQCVLSYMDDSLESPMQFIGKCSWEITFDRLDQWTEHPKMPYDLIFKPDGMSEPAFFNMEIWTGEISHRVKASKKLREWLESY